MIGAAQPKISSGLTLVEQTASVEQPTKPTSGSPLRTAVLQALDQYFRDLDGHAPREVYRMVINEVEQALLESVMDYARGNQTHTAEILGINRGTLRKKLRMYELD